MWTRNYYNLLTASHNYVNMIGGSPTAPAPTDYDYPLRMVTPNGVTYKIPGSKDQYQQPLVTDLNILAGLDPALGWTTSHSIGVALGTGTTEPTIDDYFLHTQAQGYSMKDFTRGQTYFDELSYSYKTELTIRFQAPGSVTVTELGLFADSGTNSAVMIYHEVFEPVTFGAGTYFVVKIVFDSPVLCPEEY